MKKINLITAIVFLLFIVSTLAQENIVSSFEKIKDSEDLTLKLSFHSWGEGRTTTVNLDQYFPVKRDPNSRYVYLAPPDISVSIDQTTGVVTLKAFSQWTGTREILFTLTDIYNLERATSNLQSYREFILKQRAPTRVKEEFQDLPAYHLLEKILDDLESRSSPNSKVEVEKSGNNIKINVAETIKLDVDLKTLTDYDVKTLKPKISVSISPDESSQEEAQETGLSFFIFLPLYLILAGLAVWGGIYLRKYRNKFAKMLVKEKSAEKIGVEKLKSISRELSSIRNNLDKEKIEKSTSDAYEEIKKFFNVLTINDYEYSYSEIDESKFEKLLSQNLKKKLIEFSLDISDIRFKGEKIEKSEVRKIIDKTKKLIGESLNEEEAIEYKKEREKISKTFPIKAINYVLESFTIGKPKAEKRILDIKKDVSPVEVGRGLLHRLGILKTLAEKEFEKKRDYKLKLEAIREKEREAEDRKRQKELEKQRKKEEKNKIRLMKLKEKQREEKLKLLEVQRKEKERQAIKAEKIRRRKEKIKKIRDYFHDHFGLFRTVKDLEKEIEEKRRIETEVKREKKLKQKRRKLAVLNFMHFLRLYKTPEEKKKEREILEKEELLEKQEKERKQRERKQKLISILHSLKLYRTPEDVRREKEERLGKLKEKQRRKEAEVKRKLDEKKQLELQKRLERQRIQRIKLQKKHREQILKEAERQRKRELRNLRKKELRRYLHKYLGLYKTPLDIKNAEERKKEKERKVRKFLHNNFGLYKTQEELQKEKEKLRLNLRKEQELKQLKKQKAFERKEKLARFFHHGLGLFRTSQEIKNAKLERKKHRIEFEHRVQDSIIRAIESRIKRRSLTPEQEIQILMQLEGEAIRKRKTEEAEEIKKKINELYKKVRKEKRRKTPLLMYKIANSFEEFKDYLFSKSSRLEGISPFTSRISRALQKSFSPKLENHKIEQISYLVNKAEIELKRKMQEEAKELYQRAVSLYKSMNKVSRKTALPELLKIKNEITSIAVQSSLDKAFKSMYLGQVSEAKKIYKNVEANFMNLPVHEKEKLYDKKEDLYQKIKQKPERKKFSFSFNLFRKKEKRFFPLKEERFMPREIKLAAKPELKPYYERKESLVHYLMAKKPKFPSIRTELQNRSSNSRSIQRLLDHISRAGSHLMKKDHKKAHEHFQIAVGLFKETHLSPEIKNKVYYDLDKIKQKILHTSLHNFMGKAKESLMKNKHEEARDFHKKASKIYTSLHGEKELPKSTSAELLESEITEAINILKKGNLTDANKKYFNINERYNNLRLEEKRIVYPKLVALYSELVKIGKN